MTATWLRVRNRRRTRFSGAGDILSLSLIGPSWGRPGFSAQAPQLSRPSPGGIPSCFAGRDRDRPIKQFCPEYLALTPERGLCNRTAFYPPIPFRSRRVQRVRGLLVRASCPAFSLPQIAASMPRGRKAACVCTPSLSPLRGSGKDSGVCMHAKSLAPPGLATRPRPVHAGQLCRPSGAPWLRSTPLRPATALS